VHWHIGNKAKISQYFTILCACLLPVVVLCNVACGCNALQCSLCVVSALAPELRSVDTSQTYAPTADYNALQGGLHKKKEVHATNLKCISAIGTKAGYMYSS